MIGSAQHPKHDIISSEHDRKETRTRNFDTRKCAKCKIGKGGKILKNVNQDQRITRLLT